MQLIIQIAPLLVLLVVAFGCGYGLRDYISRAGMSLRAKNSLKNIPSSGRPEKSPDHLRPGQIAGKSRPARSVRAVRETSDV